MSQNDSPIIVGLDIGTTKIAAIAGRKNEFGKLEILGFGRANSNGVQHGQVLNIDQTIKAIQQALQNCQLSNPDLEIFKPIYNIDFVKKIAKVGSADFVVLDVKSERIILGKFNPIVETKIEFDRVTGKYIQDQRFFANEKNPEKKIRDTGVCIKIEKAF
jgi:hypothetical protein